jgi:antitoxin ParD1/3/4
MIPATIPPEFEQFVAHELATGKYHSADEVICEGLRLLRAQKLDLLRREIDVGMKELDRGEGILIEDEQALGAFFDDIEARGRERLASEEG